MWCRAARWGLRFFFLPPTAESFGVSAQIGSGVVRGGPEVRFHQRSTRVPPGFHEVLRGLRGGASTKKSTACCWGYHLSLFFFNYSPTAESFVVSAQIGSGLVRGGPEVRFHEGSTRVLPGFHGVPRGSARAAGWCEH